MAPAPQTAPSPKSSKAQPPKSSSPPPSSPPPPPKKSPPPPSSPPPQRSPPPPSPSKKTSPPPPSPSKRSPPPPSQTPPAAFFPPPDNVASNQSPPPPPNSKLPKSPSHKTHHGSSDADRSDTSNEVTIVGFALAAFVFLSVITICVTCTRRRKKKKDATNYYMKPPPGGEYYKNQWGSSSHEHVVKFTTPGMMSKPVGVGSRWGTSPRSSMSAGNFSPSAMPLPNMPMPLAFNMSHFSYDELSAATGGFSKSNLLGQGGFGYVHKGILPNGQEVAVKSLKSGSNQGEREFQAEVEIISRVHHRHLVSLVGYCIADAQRLLVYEHVPNKTLEFHLHGKGCPVMSWESRIRIALGSAKGLAYLHEDCDPRIIHRDIKSSNILLDHNFEAKVADFGLAKLASVEDTHVSTRVMGTFGYLAPEYASSGKLTEKSDVFSFGVMLLELLTGKKPIDPLDSEMEESLVEWAGPLLVTALEDQKYNELVDPRLEGKYDPDEVARMAAAAAASIRHAARRRPKMSQIVRALEGDGSLDVLNDALQPPRTRSMLNLNQSPDTTTSIVYDTRAYNEDMRKFKEMVMTGQDFTSS